MDRIRPILRYRLAPALVLAAAAAGCGDDGGSTLPAEDPEIVAAVIEKIERAATREANSVRDPHLPGPKQVQVVCLSPADAARRGTPRDSVQCHADASTTPTRKFPKEIYLVGEDWRVPVQNGRLGEPEIVGEYRIKNFLRKNARLNCTGRKAPAERCTGLYPDPPEQAVPPSGPPPPSGGQQEVPINP
jgi:hypothetical protein